MLTKYEADFYGIHIPRIARALEKQNELLEQQNELLKERNKIESAKISTKDKQAE